jgi:hypothetical protein
MHALPRALFAALLLVALVSSACDEDSPAGPTCAYVVSPSRAAIAGSGGQGTIQITTLPSCSWTATTAESWLTFTSPPAGQGTGALTFAAPANPAPTERTGVITIADQTVVIVQAGAGSTTPCVYSVVPVEFVQHWHQTGGEIALTTTAGCAWTAVSTTDWLTVTTAPQGSGPDTIRFATPTFTDGGSRRAPVEVRWPTITAGQNVWVTQEGCWYAMSATNQEFPVAGGRSTVTVYGDPVSQTCSIGCPWTATSLAPWIHVISAMPRAGDDIVTYEVDANPTGQDRVGSIRVERMTLTVLQRGG